MIRNISVRKKRKGPPRRGRIRDVDYLAWIRGRACLVCASLMGGQQARTEAAHVGDRGLGQKCSDYEALPLCEWHHRTGKASAHVLGKLFWQYHQINRDEELARYQCWYEAETSRTIEKPCKMGIFAQ